jgi:O-antigen ligase
LVALAALLKTGTTAVTLPFQYWAPWVLLVLVYIGWGKEYALQSAAQILCPLLVGAAASALRPDKNDIEGFLKWCRVAAVVFLVIIVFLRVPMLLFGQLPETTGLAPEAMSAMLFQSLFLCSWLLRRNKTDLFLYLALAGFVVVSLVRGPVLGSLALVLLTLAPLGLGRRIAIAVAAAVIGLVVFNMPLMQRKMFWSGHGTLADVTWENPDLRKHTRDLMWKRLWSGIEEQPWLGHGGNADATDLLAAGFPIYLPHNDWLRILFNYGIVGCVLYAGAMILQILHGWRWAGLSPPHTRVLLFAGLSAFVPYAVVMFTDNILIYAQFYGNLHFLLLGLAYGSVAVETEQEPVPET